MCCLMQRSQIPRVCSVTTNRGGRGVQEGGDICVSITDSCWYMAWTNIILESNFFQLKKLRCLKRSDWCLWKSFKFKSKQIYVLCKTEKETQMYRTEFWTLWEKARVGCFKRTASKHVYFLGWNRSPAQVGCMSQVLGPGALGRPRGIEWRGRWEGGLGWGIHVYPWLIHVNVWQKPLQYCKVISLQLIKKIKKKQADMN